ncbi:MAG: nuclear transport factor 2 family protein [Sedimentisphaerales bacterium]|nr:nuclear transport factor 2 family protein [Sedimentisphaerales bacterium]
MNIFKSKSSDKPDTGRRSFIWKAGAAVSAALAATVPAMSMPTGKLENMEDENQIRRLHHTYETLLNKGSYENLADLFVHDGEVIFNGGIFKGKDKGIQRLFCNHFSPGMTGKMIIPAPGFELDNELYQDKVEIAADRRSATAQFSYSIQAGSPIISDSVLIKMARLQGEGIMKWWEGGIYNVSYVKDMKSGKWKIQRLEYKTLSKADYKPGRSYAKPIDIPAFSKVYPSDPAGPDKLLIMTNQFVKV